MRGGDGSGAYQGGPRRPLWQQLPGRAAAVVLAGRSPAPDRAAPAPAKAVPPALAAAGLRAGVLVGVWRAFLAAAVRAGVWRAFLAAAVRAGA